MSTEHGRVNRYAELNERNKVLKCAANYRGLKWDITSIVVYRNKETGERPCYYVHLTRHLWDGTGDREACVVVTHENDTFRASPVKMERGRSYKWNEVERDTKNIYMKQ